MSHPYFNFSPLAVLVFFDSYFTMTFSLHPEVSWGCISAASPCPSSPLLQLPRTFWGALFFLSFFLPPAFSVLLLTVSGKIANPCSDSQFPDHQGALCFPAVRPPPFPTTFLRSAPVHYVSALLVFGACRFPVGETGPFFPSK